MDQPRLALATCRSLPVWEVDDAALHAAIAARGVPFERPSWDDPAVDWSAYDAVLIRTTWDYQERLPEFRAWIDRVAAATTLFNPPAVIRWNARKTYLRELAEDGLPTIPTRWVDADQTDGAAGWWRTPAALLAETRALDGTAARFFLKPQVGATAWGTLPFDASPDGAAAAVAHLAEWLARDGIGGMMMQPFLPSVGDLGEVSVLFVDGEPAHGVRKIPVPGDYRVQDDHGASDEPWTPPAAVRDIARGAMAAAARRTGTREPLLYGRVDFLCDAVAAAAGDSADGWRIVELELIEPSLFLRHAAATAERLADALIDRARAAVGARAAGTAARPGLRS
jgi:glutathione synthase/RimK-type ligase-like ATP-grasp enzyme